MPGDSKSGALHSENGEGKLRVIFLDVGQGASQLLIGPTGKTMLIDAGNNDKEQVMLNYLRQYGVTRLDIVMGTHPDADHIGGLDKVIDYADVGRIYMPKAASNTKTFESVLTSIKRKGLKVNTAKAGLTLDWEDGVRVNMLAPVKNYDDDNDKSAVVKVVYGSTSFLLTGDAEIESEKDMIASGADLRADVLLVGHHGSKSSTSSQFLKAVHPRYGIIQVGKDNNYGHPTKTILQRLKKQGVEVYRNDLQGTVEADSDGSELHITSER
ncbi:ComEC/Rec2 family competence protein [Paenibacillus caui]|uniref:ComEC/Rec2 family competence protein n=1 Tax=Paenibacillus caui TaxID=2873927 RepID=UPI001F46396A|nr:ComEC/Rec2 family competence protein [Paenibacillus caui]